MAPASCMSRPKASSADPWRSSRPAMRSRWTCRRGASICTSLRKSSTVGTRPLATLFDERLAFAKAAEEAGIYCLHVAEHHATPLNMVPVPGVYLGAVARATKRMRLGPLVYLLPLYSPLRLIEEICILDH